MFRPASVLARSSRGPLSPTNIFSPDSTPAHSIFRLSIFENTIWREFPKCSAAGRYGTSSLRKIPIGDTNKTMTYHCRHS